MSQAQPNEHRERDSSSLTVLGGFFLMIATFVLLGTFWEDMTSFPALVNMCAGFVLLLVGLLMFGIGRRGRSASQTGSVPPANTAP